MAQPNTQTGLGNPAGTAVQSPLPQRQVTGGQAVVGTLNRAPDQPASVPRSAPAATEAPASDWGIAPEKSGMSRENKFILFVLLILVAVFSFVVFRNFQKKGLKAEVAASDTDTGEKGDKEKSEKKDQETKESASAETGKKKPNTNKASGDVTDLAAESTELFDENDKPSSEVAGPPDQTGTTLTSENAFDDDQVPTKAVSQQATKRRGVSQTPVDESDATEVVSDSEEAEVVTALPSKRGRRTVANPADQLELETEGAEPTPATRPRAIANQVEEMAEGAAESTDVPALATPASDDLANPDANEFAGDSKIDENLKQTGGTADKSAKHRVGRKLHPEVEIQDQLAQTETPVVPQDNGTGPRQTPSRRTTTQVSGPPTMRASNAGRVPPATDPNEDKYGGMVPQDVRQRPAPRGNFDPQAEPLVENTGEYVIRPNDNYWRISRKVYGTPRYFEALRKHNENVIPNTKNMKVGARISTPSRDLLEQQYGDLVPVAPAPRPPGAVYQSPTAPKTPGYFVEPGNQPAYRVGPTDNLSSISLKTLGRSSRWDEIYELNKDRLASHDDLAVGTILRLPPDASQPRLVGTPSVNH